MVAKDRSGTSDPVCTTGRNRANSKFAVLNYADQKFSTQVVPKTLNPVWNAVFDVIITPGTGSDQLEVVLWDRDRFGKDYLGQFGFSITELLAGGARQLDDPENEVRHAVL